jgi:hypothetical protein
MLVSLSVCIGAHDCASRRLASIHLMETRWQATRRMTFRSVVGRGGTLVNPLSLSRADLITRCARRSRRRVTRQRDVPARIRTVRSGSCTFIDEEASMDVIIGIDPHSATPTTPNPSPACHHQLRNSGLGARAVQPTRRHRTVRQWVARYSRLGESTCSGLRPVCRRDDLDRGRADGPRRQAHSATRVSGGDRCCMAAAEWGVGGASMSTSPSTP